MVFLVRKNNPKQIRDWNDLAKDGANIVIAKTSGNGRYAFLGAYGYGLKANNGNEQEAQKLVASILKNTPVLKTADAPPPPPSHNATSATYSSLLKTKPTTSAKN